MSVTLLGGLVEPPATTGSRLFPSPPSVAPSSDQESVNWLEHPSGPLPVNPLLDTADIPAAVDALHGFVHEVVDPSWDAGQPALSAPAESGAWNPSYLPHSPDLADSADHGGGSQGDATSATGPSFGLTTGYEVPETAVEAGGPAIVPASRQAPPPSVPHEAAAAAPLVYAPRGRPFPQSLRKRRGRRAPSARRIVSVDNNRCHLYAICQMEAPATFELGRDGRLHYDMAPPNALLGEVRQAARLCPMQAIEVRED